MYTTEQVAEILETMVRAITEGTLRKWQKRHFLAFIREQESKIKPNPLN
jgi:hypothetical protein